MTNQEHQENQEPTSSDPVFNSFFSAIVDAVSKAHQKSQEETAQMTNLQAFQRSGVINLTEDSSGVYVWMPDARI